MVNDPGIGAVLARVKIGVSISVVLIASLWWLNPFPCPPASAGAVEIFLFAVRWLIPLPFVILYPMNLVGNTRSKTAAKNPLVGKDNDLVVLPNKMLQNTIEQGLFFTFNLLMLSTYITPTFFSIIPALAINFMVGRALFFWGYQQENNIDRAYGFAMGFIINLVLLAVVTLNFVKHMILGM